MIFHDIRQFIFDVHHLFTNLIAECQQQAPLANELVLNSVNQRFILTEKLFNN